MENKTTDNNTGNIAGFLEAIVDHVRAAKSDEELLAAVHEAELGLYELINAEKLQAAGRIAGWLAHKINNPLGAISGNAQLLGRRLDRDTSDETALQTYRRYLETMQTQIERCVSITSELLEFTRSRDVEVRSVNLIQIIEDSIELVRYGRGQMDISVEASNGLSELETDRELLIRVLFEVISNAANAAGEIGSVKVSTGSNPESVWIKVTDSGAGIPGDILPRVFEPFFSTREKAKGLGLTASLSIMKQLGGTIEVEETSANGTTVAVRLPARIS